MWPVRSHLLAPLSSLTSAKVKWKWTTEHQEAFEKMKLLIAKETISTFPDFSQEFEIHTDASKLQLGACISQNGKPVAFYSRKLQLAQQDIQPLKENCCLLQKHLKNSENQSTY
jgi:RNase H-like domain found in reverse transcriptase